MGRIRGRDTGPEKRVRQLLHSLGYRFRTHAAVRGEGPTHMLVSDLQIVNGAQTTASLAAARPEKPDISAVMVQMKLCVVDPEQASEIIPLISRYANQNKVSDADFFSNHEFHRRIEEFSRRLWAPAKPSAQHETHWFYERARRQYLNETGSMGKADQRRFIQMNPRDQLITKTDLAKFENSWLQQPHIVSRGHKKIFWLSQLLSQRNGRQERTLSTRPTSGVLSPRRSFLKQRGALCRLRHGTWAVTEPTLSLTRLPNYRKCYPTERMT